MLLRARRCSVILFCTVNAKTVYCQPPPIPLYGERTLFRVREGGPSNPLVKRLYGKVVVGAVAVALIPVLLPPRIFVINEAAAL